MKQEKEGEQRCRPIFDAENVCLSLKRFCEIFNYAAMLSLGSPLQLSSAQQTAGPALVILSVYQLDQTRQIIE